MSESGEFEFASGDVYIRGKNVSPARGSNLLATNRTLISDAETQLRFSSPKVTCLEGDPSTNNDNNDNNNNNNNNNNTRRRNNNNTQRRIIHDDAYAFLEIPKKSYEKS